MVDPRRPTPPKVITEIKALKRRSDGVSDRLDDFEPLLRRRLFLWKRRLSCDAAFERAKSYGGRGCPDWKELARGVSARCSPGGLSSTHWLKPSQQKRRPTAKTCIRPLMRLFHAAGRYGDARTRRRSIRRAVSSMGFIAFPGPDLTDHLPLPFVDLLTRPTLPWLHSPIVDQRTAAAGTR